MRSTVALHLSPPGQPASTQAPPHCKTCNMASARLKRGRCDACYAYWYRYGHERPAHLWGRSFTGRFTVRPEAAAH
jgi:hypothetical protein